MKNTKILTAKGAAEYTGLALSTIYKLSSTNEIPCFKRPGGRFLYFEVEELDKWLKGEAVW